MIDPGDIPFTLDSLVSVQLQGNIWWPAIRPHPVSSFFTYSESRIIIARLLGVNEDIGIDVNASSVMHCVDSQHFEEYHNQQAIRVPDSQRMSYDKAMLEMHNLIQSASISEITRAAATPAPVPCMENHHPVTVKRADAIIWDDYFMAVAFLSAMRSKDPSTQVGACIVNSRNRIVGIGYNGFPRGCSDDVLPWARSATCDLDTKYPVSICARLYCKGIGGTYMQFFFDCLVCNVYPT